MDEGQPKKKIKVECYVLSPSEVEDEVAEEEEEEVVARPNVEENAVDDNDGTLDVSTSSGHRSSSFNPPSSPLTPATHTVTLSSHSGPEAISALEEVLAEDLVWTLKVGDTLITACTNYGKNLLLASMAKYLQD